MLTGSALLAVIFLAILFIILASSVFRVHPFFSLLLACLGVGLAVGMPSDEVVKAINDGFGGLMGYIGLVVVLGSIIGVFLEKSGAALRLAQGILRLTGPRRPGTAMSLIGGVVGVPVFCDSGFILLSGLNRAMARTSGQPGGVLSLALASGLYTTHTLVPPTPGPIAAAGNLGAGDYLGVVILIGLITAVPVIVVAGLWARWAGRRLGTEVAAEASEEENTSRPGFLMSLLPIAVPVVLIAGASLGKFAGWEGHLSNGMQFMGHPLVALLLGFLLALPLLPRPDGDLFTEWVGEGIRLAGPILVITGAGGAFGSILKATPLAGVVENWIGAGPLPGGVFLVVAFAIAALFKTAQGSSTSALVITSSMMAPLLATVGFEDPLEMALLVSAIGGGAMTVSHANDSYFWVVSQFSGISMRQAYRSFTLMTGIQGLTVLLTVLLLYYLLG